MAVSDEIQSSPQQASERASVQLKELGNGARGDEPRRALDWSFERSRPAPGAGEPAAAPGMLSAGREPLERPASVGGPYRTPAAPLARATPPAPRASLAVPWFKPAVWAGTFAAVYAITAPVLAVAQTASLSSPIFFCLGSIAVAAGVFCLTGLGASLARRGGPSLASSLLLLASVLTAGAWVLGLVLRVDGPTNPWLLGAGLTALLGAPIARDVERMLRQILAPLPAPVRRGLGALLPEPPFPWRAATVKVIRELSAGLLSWRGQRRLEALRLIRRHPDSDLFVPAAALLAREDPSEEVRLEAVELLGRWSDSQRVKEGLRAAMSGPGATIRVYDSARLLLIEAGEPIFPGWRALSRRSP